MSLHMLHAGIIPLDAAAQSDELKAKQFAADILSGAKNLMEKEGEVKPTFFVLGSTPQGPGALVLSPPFEQKEDREITFAVIKELASQTDAYGVMFLAEVAGALLAPDKANTWLNEGGQLNGAKDFILAVYEHRLLGTTAWLSPIKQDGDRRSPSDFFPIDMNSMYMKEEFGTFLPRQDISKLN